MAPQEQKRLKYICLVANDDGDADNGDGDDDYGDDDDGDDNAGPAGAEISNVQQQADGHCKGYQASGSLLSVPCWPSPSTSLSSCKFCLDKLDRWMK